MIYYKIICDQNIVGAISQNDLRKNQPKHNIMVICGIDSAQYAEYNGVYYHDNWMQPIDEDVEYTQSIITKIDEEEYNALSEALETEETIVVEPTEVQEEGTDELDETDEAVAYVKEMKLRRISNDCEMAIVAGVDVELSDGKTHHFSASLEDQINLLSLYSMALGGENHIPYHADGELCKYYSAADIIAIVNAVTTHKTFQTTYHNGLKAYVESLNDIGEISAVYYGMDVPVEYQSVILQQMYSG